MRMIDLMLKDLSQMMRDWRAAVFLLWCPWLLPFFRQAAGVYRRFWIPAPTWDWEL